MEIRFFAYIIFPGSILVLNMFFILYSFKLLMMAICTYWDAKPVLIMGRGATPNLGGGLFFL